MALLGFSSSYVEGFERILLHKNINTRQVTIEHNLCPWKFQQTVAKPEEKLYFLNHIFDNIFQLTPNCDTGLKVRYNNTYLKIWLKIW